MKPMTAANNNLAGQVCLYVGIILCVLLIPEGIYSNDGISYYSGHALTFIPYTAALGLMTWFTLRSFKKVRANKDLALRFWAWTFAILVAAVILVPYGISDNFKSVHIVLSILLFLAEYASIVWLAGLKRRDWLNMLLLATLTAAGLAMILYLGQERGYLIGGELLFQLTFGMTLYRILLQAETAPSS